VGVETVRLSLKVIPSSSRDTVAGWLGEMLKVRVTAPPERGKANAAVERLLAAALGTNRDAVRIVSGTTSPQKTVEIEGLSLAEVRRRLAEGKP